MVEEKDGLSGQMKALKEQLQQSQKELTDEKSEHQMTKLRSEQQDTWSSLFSQKRPRIGTKEACWSCGARSKVLGCPCFHFY